MKGIVITKLYGGLGNQMFQYAAAKSIAIEARKDFRIDTRSLTQSKERQFRLAHAGLSIPEASEADLHPFFNETFTAKFRRVLGRPKYKIFKQNEQSYFEFNPEIARTRTFGVYLDGYWQNPLYFEKTSSTLRNDFSLDAAKLNHPELLKDISDKNSVAVHVRRGDFLNPETNKIHGTLPLEYYKQAVEMISGSVRDPFFYFFSDDIAWCRTNFTGVNFIFASNPSHSEVDDLCLMKSCKHQIIANSTFSWWGAWLNTNPDKIVIAPKNWFAYTPWNLRAAPLVPLPWIRI